MPVIHAVKNWSPFNIDAVGLITLLGTNSLEKCLGRLVKHPWGECLPLLAGHIIPDNLILEPVPGFLLYNITDGIKVDGINAWFSRWLLSQEMSPESTILHVSALSRRHESHVQDTVSVTVGTVIHAFLIVFAALIADWYGFAAAVCLALSTLTRVLTLRSCRARLDTLFKRNTDLSTMPVKVVVRLPNNCTVTIHTTRGIVIKCIVGEILPRNARQYRVLRILGWAAFGVFIVALGMACLALQLITVVVMLVSTVVIIKKVGCDDANIGSFLHIDSHTMEGKGSHKRTYAALQLNPVEEEAMVLWNMFPLRTNKQWWVDYYDFSQEYTQSPTVAMMLTPPTLDSKLDQSRQLA